MRCEADRVWAVMLTIAPPARVMEQVSCRHRVILRVRALSDDFTSEPLGYEPAGDILHSHGIGEAFYSHAPRSPFGDGPDGFLAVTAAVCSRVARTREWAQLPRPRLWFRRHGRRSGVPSPAYG